MSRNTAYSVQYPRPPEPTQDFSQQDDYKTSYDDLVDGRHQTHTVQTPFSGSLRRGPSTLLCQNSSISAKHSVDVSIDTTYPPKAIPVKEVDSGFWQKILPESLACRLFVMTVLIETTIDLAIEGELLLRVQKATDADPTSFAKMPVYLSIFALAHVFQFVMAVDAVYARNTLQFIFLILFNASLLLYGVVQIDEVKTVITDTYSAGISGIPINVLTIIIPIVIGISEIAYIALGWKIYHEFGWKVYKSLGADRRIKRMNATYQVYECLVKFDVFFWAGFSVQFIWLVLQRNDWEYYVTIAALPLSIVLLVEGHLAARYENKWMMATFMSGCVGAMVYFIYKLIKVVDQRESPQFKSIWKSLLAFSVLAIVLLIATFVYSVLVLRNFGRGLKDAFNRNKDGHNRFNSQNRLAASTNPNRISIQ